MGKKLWRLGMLAILGWCLQSSIAEAQSPVFVEVVPVSYSPANFTTGTVSYADVRGATAAPREGFHPIHKMCDDYVARLGCAADFNQAGCGSCYSHLLFMFGSCRTFFGPSCEPAPLPGFFGIANHNSGSGASGGCANGSCGSGGCSTCGK